VQSSYTGGIIREFDSKLLIVNGPADHVHPLLSISAKVSIADVLPVLKTNSSRWVHQSWPSRRDFAWQTGYGAFSVSLSQSAPVRTYIEKQEEHHRKVTFKEEFLSFLKQHGLEHDVRYIWE
jgi:putative transposase